LIAPRNSQGDALNYSLNRGAPLPESAGLNVVVNKLTGVPDLSEWNHPGGCQNKLQGSRKIS